MTRCNPRRVRIVVLCARWRDADASRAEYGRIATSDRLNYRGERPVAIQPYRCLLIACESERIGVGGHADGDESAVVAPGEPSPQSTELRTPILEMRG